MLMYSHAERVQFGRTFVFTPFPVSPLGQSPPPTLFNWPNLADIWGHIPSPQTPWLPCAGFASKLRSRHIAQKPVLRGVKITPYKFAYVPKNHYISI